MAIKRPKTYKNFVPPDTGKAYQITGNSNGTSKITDVTVYITEGDNWTAADANALWDAVEGFVSSVVSATLLASAWADKTYTLSVSGVTASSNQEILPAVDITQEQLEALQAANIQDGGQAAGSITLKAFGDVPTIDIPIRVILRGDA